MCGDAMEKVSRGFSLFISRISCNLKRFLHFWVNCSRMMDDVSLYLVSQPPLSTALPSPSLHLFFSFRSYVEFLPPSSTPVLTSVSFLLHYPVFYLYSLSLISSLHITPSRPLFFRFKSLYSGCNALPPFDHGEHQDD